MIVIDTFLCCGWSRDLPSGQNNRHQHCVGMPGFLSPKAGAFGQRRINAVLQTLV